MMLRKSAAIAITSSSVENNPTIASDKNGRDRISPPTNKKITLTRLATAIGGSTMQLGFLLMSRNVYVYGTGAMAAYGIGNKVNGLITLPSNGIGSAVATIVGQNIGANQIDRA